MKIADVPPTSFLLDRNTSTTWIVLSPVRPSVMISIFQDSLERNNNERRATVATTCCWRSVSLCTYYIFVLGHIRVVTCTVFSLYTNGGSHSWMHRYWSLWNIVCLTVDYGPSSVGCMVQAHPIVDTAEINTNVFVIKYSFNVYWWCRLMHERVYSIF